MTRTLQEPQAFVNFCSVPAVRYVWLVCLCLFASEAFAQRSVPEHGGYWVHDEAQVLSADTRSLLESILKGERDSTTNQIAVLLIPSLEGEALEDYSLRVAEKWGLGRKDRDNGVLLLIAINDRVMRIETGYGLEATLTDAISSRINRNEIAPYFRTGDYNAGVVAGVRAIISAIAGEYTNEDPQTTRRSARRSPLTTIIIFIVILILASRRGRGGRGGGGYWSSGSGWVGSMGGFGGNGGSWGSGSDFGGGGGFGGGGSSNSW